MLKVLMCLGIWWGLVYGALPPHSGEAQTTSSPPPSSQDIQQAMFFSLLEIRAAVEEMSKTLEAAMELKAQLENLGALEEKVDNIKEAVMEMKDEQENLGALEEKVDNIKEAVMEMKDEQGSCSSEVATKTDEVNQLKEVVSQLKEEVNQAKGNMTQWEQQLSTCQQNIPSLQERARPPRDCEDVFQFQGITESGVHQIFPKGDDEGISVWCHLEKDWKGQLLEEDPWTIFLNRQRQTPQLNFNRTWEGYKGGFGDPAREYWIGNEWLHALTGGRAQYRLRVIARDFDGDEERQGYWGTFSVGDEATKYQLSIGNYENSTSSLGDSLADGNGQKFSTIDQDNDKSSSNCVVSISHGGGGGLWYKHCGYAFLTSPMSETGTGGGGLTWYYFKPSVYGRRYLSSLAMMVKRQS